MVIKAMVLAVYFA